MDPSTKVLVTGFIPNDPEQNTRPPNLVACESGGYGPGALSVFTISRAEYDMLYFLDLDSECSVEEINRKLYDQTREIDIRVCVCWFIRLE